MPKIYKWQLRPIVQRAFSATKEFRYVWTIQIKISESLERSPQKKIHSDFATNLTSIVAGLPSSTEGTGGQDEDLLCDRVDLADALGVAHDRQLSLAHAQWNGTR